MKINESNFKIICLKNDCDDEFAWFYKDEILECKNGIITWGGKKKEKGNNIYKSYNDFIDYWEKYYIGYFELIEVDGLSAKEYYELKAKEELEDVLEENLDVIMVAISNICQLYNYEPNSKFIQDLFDTKLQKWYDKCCKDNDK